MEDFNGAKRPPDTDTVIGTLQGTPGEGTSPVETPTLRFLHRLLKEAPDLEKEMAKLQQKGRVEQDGARLCGKSPMMSVIQWENNIVKEQEEEIARR